MARYHYIKQSGWPAESTQDLPVLHIEGLTSHVHGVRTDMQVFKDDVPVGGLLDQVKAVGGLKPVTYEIYAR